MPDSDCEVQTLFIDDTVTIKDCEIWYVSDTVRGSIAIKAQLPWEDELDWYELYPGYENRLRFEHNSTYRSIELITFGNRFATLRVCTEKESSWWWKIFEYFFGDVKTLLVAAFSILGKKWSEVTDAITAAIDGLSDIVDHTWSEVTGAISTAIDGLSDIVDHTWSEVTGAITAAIDGLSDIVDHTWSEVTGAITTAIDNLSDIVDHTWSEVTGAVDTATEGIKIWFGKQEEMVYGWISEKWVDKILDLVDSNVDKFKDKIWNLVEKIVEKL